MDRIAPLTVFTGNITSFKLVSNDLCFGPCPQPDDIIEQHLSIHADGRVWLSYYCFGDGDKYKRTETKRLKLSEHQAGYILSEIQNFFETADPIQLLFVDDSGDGVLVRIRFVDLFDVKNSLSNLTKEFSDGVI